MFCRLGDWADTYVAISDLIMIMIVAAVFFIAVVFVLREVVRLGH